MRLRDVRTFGAEMKIAVEIVFDQRNLLPCEQMDETLFRGVGHKTADRVIKVRDDETSADATSADHPRERIQIETGARMGGNLERFQAELSDELDDPEVSGRLD